MVGKQFRHGVVEHHQPRFFRLLLDEQIEGFSGAREVKRSGGFYRCEKRLFFAGIEARAVRASELRLDRT